MVHWFDWYERATCFSNMKCFLGRKMWNDYIRLYLLYNDFNHYILCTFRQFPEIFQTFRIENRPGNNPQLLIFFSAACCTYIQLWNTLHFFKGTAGCKNKFIFIDCQWLVKTNGATFVFIEHLSNKFLPGQFWPCLSFASLSVPSVMVLSPKSCGPKLRRVYSYDMNLCCGVV